MPPARDRYEAYFAEKLWEPIPAVHRDEDGRKQPPGQLRAFVEMLAAQAAVLRRSTDRAWDDFFVDLADDWAVSYLGDLVATRMVSALNHRARRVDVAKTIYYRRRKGTPRVLEELIADITGWEGKVVEEFRRLGRARHGLDQPPRPLAGPFTGTLPGGLADLRETRGAELADGPFDEFHHTPDVRRPRGIDGRYGIPKLGFHLFRLAAYGLNRVMPHEWPAPGPNLRALSVDPSGRDVPLFMPRRRAPDWDQWTSAREWDLPQPIHCRLLNHAEYVIAEGEVELVRTSPALAPAVRQAAANELVPFIGTRFHSEDALRTLVGTLVNAAAILNVAVFRPLLVSALVPECGKAALLPAAVAVELVPGGVVPRERTVGGNLTVFAGNPTDKQLIIDPDRGRLLLIGVAGNVGVRVTTFHGFSGPVGAGGYARPASVTTPTVAPIAGGGAIAAVAVALNGVTQIDDSATYTPVANLTPVRRVVLQAADRQRPYLELTANWVLDTGVNQNAELILTGLWVGGRRNLANAAIVLQGDYERVVIRHATLDPGGTDAQGGALPAVHLVVAGAVHELTIESSIVGPVRVQGGGAIERLVVRDSIVHSRMPGVVGIDLPASDVSLERVTVLGAQENQLAVDVNRLDASEALVTGVVDVTNTQAGCFRFSAAPEGSRVPHAYQSHVIKDTAHYFTARVFGHPGYAQLSRTVPEGLRRGAENGSEIGAFSGLLNPIKEDSLQAKVAEFMPFGLIPMFIFET